MTEKQDPEQAAQDPERVARHRHTPTLPPKQIMIAVDAKESTHHACGEQRIRSMFPEQKISREVATAITQRCYELQAGGKTKLKISFRDSNEKASPKGTLVLEPDRGKISPSRIELDGKKHEVTVEYTAPDETIRVSVRAFLEGFARGKVHLHLEA